MSRAGNLPVWQRFLAAAVALLLAAGALAALQHSGQSSRHVSSAGSSGDSEPGGIIATVPDSGTGASGATAGGSESGTKDTGLSLRPPPAIAAGDGLVVVPIGKHLAALG